MTTKRKTHYEQKNNINKKTLLYRVVYVDEYNIEFFQYSRTRRTLLSVRRYNLFRRAYFRSVFGVYSRRRRFVSRRFDFLSDAYVCFSCNSWIASSNDFVDCRQKNKRASESMAYRSRINGRHSYNGYRIFARTSFRLQHSRVCVD